MDTILPDLKYSLRSLWRDKGFVATVVLTFAVCIAANTALFAIVDGVILRPLPVPDANSIMIMSNDYPKAGVAGGNNSASGDYFDRLREMTAFETQALFHDRNRTIELNGTPQQPVRNWPQSRFPRRRSSMFPDALSRCAAQVATLQSTGKPIEVQAMNFYTLSGGQFVEERGQPDLLGLLQQIGAVPR